MTPTLPSIIGSHFDGNRPTKFLVHGFTDDGHSPWIQTMKNELLNKVNVFHRLFCNAGPIVSDYLPHISIPKILKLFDFSYFL